MEDKDEKQLKPTDVDTKEVTDAIKKDAIKKETDSEDDYINSLVENIGVDADKAGTEEQPSFEELFMTTTLADAIGQLLHLMSSLTGLKSLELTPDDKIQLKEALKPFGKDLLKYIKYMKYMPIIIFSLGMLLRVVNEIKEKREAKKKENKVTITHDKKPAGA